MHLLNLLGTVKKLNLDINITSKKWNDHNIDLNEFISKFASEALSACNIFKIAESAELSILLTTDQKIRKLNNEYRGKDKPTNVLSFPLQQINPGKFLKSHALEKVIYLGDIIFAYATIKKEALREEKDFLDHFAHLIIHGTLHLIGFDHECDLDANQMEEIEIKLLAKFGIASPYGDKGQINKSVY